MIINIIAGGIANHREIPKVGRNWFINFTFMDPRVRMEEIDMVFMMDGISGQSMVRKGASDREDIVELMNQKKVKLVTPWIEKGVEKSIPYPLNKIKEKYDLLYFKSSIAFALGYAALVPVAEVHLWGIDQSDHLAYLFERPSVEFWIGVLKGRGVKVVSHDRDTRLFGGRPSFGGRTIYGYEMKENKALRHAKRYEDIVPFNESGAPSETANPVA